MEACGDVKWVVRPQSWTVLQMVTWATFKRLLLSPIGSFLDSHMHGKAQEQMEGSAMAACQDVHMECATLAAPADEHSHSTAVTSDA